MVDPEQFWSQSDEFPADPGLSEEEIRNCGTRFGVRFPDSFVELFRVQNGGPVRDEDLVLYPLRRVVAPGNFGVCTVESIIDDDEFVREMIAEELGDPRLVLLIAGDDGHTYHALDFNSGGPFGEPRVVWIDNEAWDCAEVSPSFGEFVEGLMRSDGECAVDLGEIDRLEVIAHEIVDYGPGGPRIEQHMCDTGESLVLFLDGTGLTGPDAHELSRVEILRPVNADVCTITALGPKPDQIFSLMLAPEDPEAIQWTTSRETGDGRWKNRTSRGVPFYTQFQSAERSRLEELRLELLGGVVSERAAAEEEWRERVEEMSEEEMEAAFPHMMLEMMGSVEELIGELDPDETPEELKPAVRQMEQMKARMRADLQQRAAGSAPPNAELLDLMRQLMPKPEDFDVDDFDED